MSILESSATEPSLIDYARYHGLAVDHQCRDLKRLLSSEVLVDDNDASFQHLMANMEPVILKEEKFRLERKAATKLASCLRPPPFPRCVYGLSDVRRSKKLKLEEPLLSTASDHCVRKHSGPDLLKKKVRDMGQIKVNEDEGEGLQWPLKTSQLSSEWDYKLRHEKLQVSHGTINALQEMLKPPCLEGIDLYHIEGDMPVRKDLAPRPVSPPLMPMSWGNEAYIPSSSIAHLPLPPEPPDPCGEPILNLDETMSWQSRGNQYDENVNHSDQVPESLDLGQTVSAPRENGLDGSEAEDKRNAKPLLDSISLQSLSTKFSRSPKLRSEGGDVHATNLSMSSTSSASKQAGLKEYDALHCKKPSGEPFENCWESRAEEAYATEPEPIFEGENNLLVEVPGLSRVNVQDIHTTHDPRQSLQAMVLDQPASVQDTVDAERLERQLNWNPIPSMITTSMLKEQIENDDEIVNWTAQPRVELTSKNLLWEPPMLRILCPDEESESDLDIDDSLMPELEGKKMFPPCRPDSLISTGLHSKQEVPPIPRSAEVNGPSILGSLTGFMGTRMVAKEPPPNLEMSKTSSITSEGAAAKHQPQIIPSAPTQVPGTLTSSPDIHLGELPCPEPPLVCSTLTVFFSSQMLRKYRDLTQALDASSLPAFDIIYRDLYTEGEDGLSAPDIIVSPKTAALVTTLQAVSQRPLPGQGGSSIPPILQRVSNISVLFEKVFLLVTLPSSEHMAQLSRIVVGHMTRLVVFCASLSTTSNGDVQPIMIPWKASDTTSAATQAASSGPVLSLSHPSTSDPISDTPLYRWLHFLIAKHAFGANTTTSTITSQPLTFLHEETVWELFLCKAGGLNPFAAQLVLATLKRPDVTADISREKKEHSPKEKQMGEAEEETKSNTAAKGGKGENHSQHTLWGLPAFIHMTPEQRMDMFGDDLGPAVVERVSKILDARAW